MGKTALRDASLRGSEEMARVLVKAGSDTAAKPSNGEIVLDLVIGDL